MRRQLIVGLAIVVSVAGSVLMNPGAAAAEATTLYVNNTTGSGCSDSGTGAGTVGQPYCTIGAAVAVVAPGQTVSVTGTYAEQVTIARSGTADQPITIMGVTRGAARLSGLNAGFSIDGQHDVKIVNFTVTGVQTHPTIAVSNSARIAVQDSYLTTTLAATVVGLRLAGVTDSSLTGLYLEGGPGMPAGVALDAATTRVVIRNSAFGGSNAAGRKGVDVAGSGNTIIDNKIVRANVAGIFVEPGAANNILANNYAGSNIGSGIEDVGGTGTAIANNTAQRNCGTGIRVAGTASGVSVQNNIAVDNGAYLSGCAQPTTDTVDIGVYDSATDSIVVDYNTTHQSSATVLPYAWNTPMGLVAFRAASGQAAHDIVSGDWSVNDDSANSAAPGYQSLDYQGHFREDNPAVADTGAGPISYADRGESEHVTGPTAQLALGTTGTAGTISVDASASTPGWAPIASYTFSFGDGATLTQATPTATHHYTEAAINFDVTVVVTDTNGVTGTTNRWEACQPTTPAGNPAARVKADFNGDGRDDVALLYANGGGTFTVSTSTSRDCGTLDAPVRRWQGQFAGSRVPFMATGDFNGDGRSDIALLRDYGNGHVSLVTLTADANGDGGFAAPVVRWDAPYWGVGTRNLTVGDFNGDGKADVGLFFSYGGSHVALFTLTAGGNGDGGFAAPVARWDGPYWGSGTTSVNAGDFNGDGRDDVGLFFSYGGSHVALFTLTANSGGGLAAPVVRWDAPYWGSGTRFVTARSANTYGPADIALLFDYGAGHVAEFILPTVSGGGGAFGAPALMWDGPAWGSGTRFVGSGSFAGIDMGSGYATAGMSLFFDYGGGHVGLFGLYGNSAPVLQWDLPTWGGGTVGMS